MALFLDARARHAEGRDRTRPKGVRTDMYRFSRSIYREIAPRVIEDEHDPTSCRNKQRVLDACEGTVRRLAIDGRYFARPARTLFNDVRVYFAMNDQLAAWR